MADVLHYLQGEQFGGAGAGIEAEKLQSDLESVVVASLPDLAEANRDPTVGPAPFSM